LAVKNGSEYVDTSGNLYPEDAYDDWEKQVAYILEEGDKMNLDWKAPNDADKDTATKVEEEADRFMDADGVDEVAEKAAEKEYWTKADEEEAEDRLVVESEQSREDGADGAESEVDEEELEAPDTMAGTELATATVKVKGLVRALISFPMARRQAGDGILRVLLITGLSDIRDFLFRVRGSFPGHLCLSISRFIDLNTLL
jgi:hypothetical protein